jgi:hypothetical protein
VRCWVQHAKNDAAREKKDTLKDLRSSSVHGNQVHRSATLSGPSVGEKGVGEKGAKPKTMPLRHTESFSKRQRNAWYAMPWVTQADPSTKEGCWEAPGPSEFEVKCQIGEGLTSAVYLARIRRANVRASLPPSLSPCSKSRK